MVDRRKAKDSRSEKWEYREFGAREISQIRYQTAGHAGEGEQGGWWLRNGREGSRPSLEIILAVPQWLMSKGQPHL